MTKIKFDHIRVKKVTEELLSECLNLLSAGQKEYAGSLSTPFGNFERISDRLGISREAVLLVYATKHLDGIFSFVNGHKSQRENVRGRIHDLIVYMCILRAMIDETEEDETEEK